jgi:CubicO group peptidase (beta-lactamase class C family)
LEAAMIGTVRRALFPGLLAVCVAAPVRPQTSPGLNAAEMQRKVQQHIDHVTSGLTGPIVDKNDSHSAKTLSAEMAAMHVPGVSIAVVHNGAIEWARGFGVATVGGAPVTAETLFQAGSISKPVAAMAALRLVQQGKMSLDADINTYLMSWKLPASAVAAGKPVTLRELLTHTGGTTVHGFAGYAAGEPVPTLVQVLNGLKPANSEAIRVDMAPGTKWRYSCGGYTIVQQALIDVAKQPFPKLLHDTVLAPIGMTHSTYEQPLPKDWKQVATPYNDQGKPIPGGAHTYPEMAAAGLWTTATDLAKYVIENQRSLEGKANHVLSEQMTKQMVTPGMGNHGLGPAIGGSPSRPFFTHGGVDEGFEALFVGYEQGGDGAVVMTNAQGGIRIAQEIMSSIATEYGWPDFRPIVRTSIVVDPKVLAQYVGTYELGPQFSLAITLDGRRLMAQATGEDKSPLLAESQTKFFSTDVGSEVEFVRDEKGEVAYMVLHRDGHDVKATKK